MTRRSRTINSVLIAVAITLVAGLTLRFGTNIAALGPIWDEPLMQRVVESIVTDGWTVQNTIDYEETKGPSFFWTYAALGELMGTSIDDLRLITLAMFILTGVPLGLIAARCGLSSRQIAGAAALYVLLPYNAVLGQMFMSEASFMLGSMFLLVTFVWGFGSDFRSQRRAAGPIVFGLLLSILLHHRIHAVAFAGAAMLVSFERDRWRSWPWWLACFAAGLTRLPLYLRWDGLVSPEYQHLLGIGLRLDSLTYLAISLLPCTVVLLWPALMDRSLRHCRWWIAAAAVLGLAFGVLAVPDLSLTAQDGKARYLGMVATALRPLQTGPVLLFAIAALSTIGFSALAASAAVAFSLPLTGSAGVVHRLAAWSVLVGWGMYALTRGVVFDRYPLPFVALLPFVLSARTPQWLLVLQALGLLGVVIKLAMSHGML